MSVEELAALSHSELVQLVLRLQAEVVTLQTALDALRDTPAAPPKPPANSSLPPSTAFKPDRAARRRAAKADGEHPAKRGPKFGHPGVSR